MLGGDERLYVGSDDGLWIFCGDAGGLLLAGRALEGAAVLALTLVGGTFLLVGLGDGTARESFDGGQSWLATGAPAPEPIGLRAATSAGPLALANPRLRGATAYARLGGNPPALLGAGAGGMQIFRSEDAGIHWEPAHMEIMLGGPITALIPATSLGAAWAGAADGSILRGVDGGRLWQVAGRAGAAVRCLATG
ncbi:hypothetical protein K2Z83_16235 [Oscillochloris sp. ZM17-4]|uniref:hypothetical protein n=1 Tax=Oscillochloris sp. ZM17-4 TaxID=2866714 RepID=UPI001C732431|nr:hypothetical protein [Oscillochloris sp. ZM17-4]MBX0329223.1 hypothetical protein [Oscillochloris sp. ZM17-4]